MLKVSFLMSHIPDPRLLRRIKAIEDNFDICVVYWDRGMSIKEDFTISPRHEIYRILIDAPMGKPLKRIVPLIKFRKLALNKLISLKPNIIHAANLDMLSIANKYRKEYDPSVKIIYEIADLSKHSFKSKNVIKEILFKGMRIYEKVQTKDISYIFLTSPYFWEEYYSKFIDKEKYIFVPNAPYRSLFNAYSGKQGNRQFTIGFIGSVRYVEQLKMLIDSVENIENDQIKVLIAGSGPGLEIMNKYVINKDFVEIYGPYNYEKDIVNLYEKIDLVYSVYDSSNPNVKIALPNRLYEALVCSLPIIVAKQTALESFVLKHSIGSSVSNSQELAEIIELYKHDNGYYLEKKENMNRIKDNYYYEIVENKVLEKFLELVK